MAEGNEFTLYFAVSDPDEMGARLRLSQDPRELESWLSDEEMPPHAEDPAKDSAQQAEEKPFANLKRLMENFAEAMSNFHPLVEVSTMAVPAMYGITVNREFGEDNLKKYKLIKEVGKGAIYGVDKDSRRAFEASLDSTIMWTKSLAVLPGAVLLSLVATYDYFVADLLREMVRTRPERFGEAGKTVLVKEVLAMKSFEELIDKLVESEVDIVMRGSHVEQVAHIEKRYDVKIISHYASWPTYVEIFERRNLVAHGAAVVNSRYLSNCNEVGISVGEIKVGSTLELSGEYLHSSSDILTEFGLLLNFVLWKKTHRDEIDELHRVIHYITYDMIKSKRYIVSANILDFVLNKQNNKISDRLRLMMTINHANALKLSGDTGACDKIINQVDWSASANDFKICVAAIRNNFDDFCTLLPKVLSESTITRDDVLDWPVFKTIREHEGFSKTLNLHAPNVKLIESNAAPAASGLH